jgi:hypothetical protein
MGAGIMGTTSEQGTGSMDHGNREQGSWGQGAGIMGTTSEQGTGNREHGSIQTSKHQNIGTGSREH